MTYRIVWFEGINIEEAVYRANCFLQTFNGRVKQTEVLKDVCVAIIILTITVEE